MADYVTRFAPSPTGPLHLGHAFSALTAWDRAQAMGGTALLRIEDIDRSRARPEWEVQIYDDLRWLGLDWPEPVMRQSERGAAYQAALDRLADMGLIYPCRCTRSDIRAALSAPQEGVIPMGPDGLIYPGICRGRGLDDAGPDDALRLDMAAAMRVAGTVRFAETGPLHAGHYAFDEGFMVEHVGDVVLSRRGVGVAYHLAVVVDDAQQGVTEAVRGADLFEAAAVHALLQRLLDLPRTDWHHHALIRDTAGKRLAKRDDARALAQFRAEGLGPQDIRRMVGL
ncbi:tRNA glutamyl-Q(34) synthetase GluQRS [Fertoebacter nigrum]|uniref:tRNA glutamyl-Q(34) synthetase GluQRS n=1 Tax=Fertoeibacter niger TaxID=2656921 RepID=A0A8X8GSH4_9RHOB|nr:tRNA glutamyl-Q(34) synthetase GluQRS [Fertoeibacter niger]NUB43524.1 tRNA glutamyl-Q(34) synthetase GluQRS [Fertoeibacter niger]